MFWLSDVWTNPENSRQSRQHEDQERGRRAHAKAFRHVFIAAGRGLLGLGAAAKRGIVSWFQGRYNRRKALRDLNYLDDHLLADIGLTRNDVALLHRGKWPTRYAEDLHESTNVAAETQDQRADTRDDQQHACSQRAA